MDFITYIIFRFFVALVAIMPFRLIYIFSDFFYFLFYKVAGYRKKVVFENIRNSFPDKNEKEIEEIAKAFYRHLSDIFVESLKAFTVSEHEMEKRFIIKPSPMLENLYKEGKSVIVVAGHYNNWEWPGIASGNQIVHKPVGFYKPLSNKYMDGYLKKSRVKGRPAIVSITDTAGVFKTDWGEPAAFYMIADQSPSSVRMAYWVKFLHQDTATLHGPEKYAKIYNMPVFFAAARKIKRGYYEAEFILIHDNPATTKAGEITQLFMKMLEETVNEAPQYYLWSHRRWKHKREDALKQSPVPVNS